MADEFNISPSAESNPEYNFNQVNLVELYRKKLGYVAPPFPVGGIPDPKNQIPFRKFLNKGNTQLGQPIRMPVRLRIPKEGEEWYQLPNEPIVSVDNSFITEKTMINRGNSRGSVKEIITEDDWNITIEGLIINGEADDYPEADISELRRIISHPGVLEIDSMITRILGIRLVVRDNIGLPRSTDSNLRVQNYTLSFISDEDFELELV